MTVDKVLPQKISNDLPRNAGWKSQEITWLKSWKY